MVITLSEVLTAPGLVCLDLMDRHAGVQVDRWHRSARTGAVIDVTFTPPPELARAGYVAERARLSVWPDGAVLTFPLGPARPWRHRQPSPFGPGFGTLAGELCLYYRDDPRALRWAWEDGFDQYLTRVHRHLFFEEYWRRTGHWPVEDAPHGRPSAGVHPILSAQMKDAAKRWAGS